MIGLEIGGGNRPFRRDFEQLDIEDWYHETGLTYTVCDARQLPYRTESVPQIYAGNILEHFPATETIPILEEWARVLKIGGVLELLVPDVLGILDHYFAEQINWEDCAVRLRGTDGHNRHRAGFTLHYFPALIDQVPTLVTKVCETFAENAGIHVLAVRISDPE